MPRSYYPPKSSYCPGTRQPDPIFERMIWFFLHGSAADETSAVLKSEFGEDSGPSDKTVGKFFRRIGDALYDIYIDKVSQEIDPNYARLKVENPKVIDEFYQEAFQRLHEDCITPLNPRFLSALRKIRDLDLKRGIEPDPAPEFLYDTDMATLYRRFSANKNGISQSSKGHLALAHLHAKYRAKFGEDKVAGADVSNELMLEMFKDVKAALKAHKC